MNPSTLGRNPISAVGITAKVSEKETGARMFQSLFWHSHDLELFATSCSRPFVSVKGRKQLKMENSEQFLPLGLLLGVKEYK